MLQYADSHQTDVFLRGDSVILSKRNERIPAVSYC